MKQVTMKQMIKYAVEFIIGFCIGYFGTYGIVEMIIKKLDVE